ncbi:hypothetical protein BLOT_016579 [Blomia tropicalis]|nr:hypothetical protein BLOT_016579 [Blomia tropicalis]
MIPVRMLRILSENIILVHLNNRGKQNTLNKTIWNNDEEPKNENTFNDYLHIFCILYFIYDHHHHHHHTNVTYHSTSTPLNCLIESIILALERHRFMCLKSGLKDHVQQPSN